MLLPVQAPPVHRTLVLEFIDLREAVVASVKKRPATGKQRQPDGGRASMEQLEKGEIPSIILTTPKASATSAPHPCTGTGAPPDPYPCAPGCCEMDAEACVFNGTTNQCVTIRP
jgi:hypothetical protein